MGASWEDTAVLMYTGGTTGVSKGAQLTHQNIFVNAYQAMGEDKGSLSVELREEAGNIFISFSDEGPGIKAPLESIYDLFHTTKKDGTGFGLFRAQRVIKAHCGAIYAENRPGQGATFTIKLPIQ